VSVRISVGGDPGFEDWSVMSTHGGLFDGFEGYRTVTDQDRAEAIKNSLVVLDTNVLLGLYNFQGMMLEDYTRVLDAIGDRLFIPHQVMDEFWRNRRTVLSENQGRHREHATIEKAFNDIESSFAKWHHRVVDRNAPPRDALRELSEARRAILDYMAEKNAISGASTPDTPTQSDHVLTHLERLLQDRVGAPPDAAELETLRSAGRRRISAKRPPGYMDAEKNPERAVGDFLVWRQTIDEAAARGLPVLFVTQDMKEDWWADRSTDSRRARPELVAELLEETGQRLIMIRSTDLVALGSHVGVQVSEATLDEADKVAEADDAGNFDDTDWIEEDVIDYKAVLEDGWPGHARVLEEAVANGGRITRDRMAEILGKDPDESMKGSGRPYGTAMRQLGWGDEPIPFYAFYEAGGLMSHFVLDDALVPLFEKVYAAALPTNQPADTEDLRTRPTPAHE
jgi:hypothetical protein